MIDCSGACLFTLFLIVSGSVISVFAGKLTRAGAAVGVFIAFSLYLPAGYPPLYMLGVFFVSAVAATSWGKSKKQQVMAAFPHQTKRSAVQVLANAGVPAAAGMLIYIFPQYSPIFLLMIASSIASATADTLSSELGMIYGRRFVNILTFKRDSPGLDGVVSIEGTLAGLVGALLIALVFCSNYQAYEQFPIVVLAGMGGNVIDSVLGAVLERRGYLTNNWVNFLNSLFAALFALSLLFLFG